MILTALITPLTSKPKNNQYNQEQAMKEGKPLPELKNWFEIEHNVKAKQLVGETIIETSVVEKLKWHASDDPILGKEQKVSVEMTAYSFDGKTGISAKIMSVIK